MEMIKPDDNDNGDKNFENSLERSNTKYSDTELITQNDPYRLSKSIFFATSGILSLSPYSIMLTQADFFNKKFPDLGYNFLISSPYYIGVPIAFLIAYLIENTKVKYKLPLFVILITLVFWIVFIFAVFLDSSLISFYMIIGSYICSSTFVDIF